MMRSGAILSKISGIVSGFDRSRSARSVGLILAQDFKHCAVADPTWPEAPVTRTCIELAAGQSANSANRGPASVGRASPLAGIGSLRVAKPNLVSFVWSCKERRDQHNPEGRAGFRLIAETTLLTMSMSFGDG